MRATIFRVLEAGRLRFLRRFSVRYGVRSEIDTAIVEIAHAWAWMGLYRLLLDSSSPLRKRTCAPLSAGHTRTCDMARDVCHEKECRRFRADVDKVEPIVVEVRDFMSDFARV